MFRVKKVIREKAVNYMLNAIATKILLTVEMIKKDVVLWNESFPEVHTHSKNKI